MRPEIFYKSIQKDAPGICPRCGSNNVNFSETEYEEMTNRQDCGCLECGLQWVEVYKFDHKEIQHEDY